MLILFLAVVTIAKASLYSGAEEVIFLLNKFVIGFRDPDVREMLKLFKTAHRRSLF